MFLSLPGIHEPSAVQQLPDGRLLVAEDEKEHPFSLLTLHADGRASAVPLNLDDAGDALGKLDDLEGLAADAGGSIYAITSHSRDGDGDEKKSREKLVRFRVEGDRAVAAKVFRGLKPVLAAAHPLLAAAAQTRDVKGAGGLNIEALDVAPDGRLLIGFRSPLRDGRALLATLENPGAVFDADATPLIGATLESVDLGGEGLRGMSWIAALNGYLLISGPVAREAVHFRLWFWPGPGAPARQATVTGLPGFEHAEGICPAVIDGRPHLLVVSDDGERKTGRAARFLLLRPEQLEIQA